MNEAIRYRLYRCGQNHVEVWDTLEKQWEDENRLPDGQLLLVLEDIKKDSIKRFRERALQLHKVSESRFATWDCT